MTVVMYNIYLLTSAFFPTGTRVKSERLYTL
jgi:hypothetical protein